MKKLVTVLLAPLCLVSFSNCNFTEGFKKTAKRGRDLASSTKRIMPVRTTAYTHSERDHIAYSNRNAIGTRLKYYSGVRSAAADWSRFPVGTRFQIIGQPGVTYEIDDYGSALVGKNTIDLYKPNRAKMNAWGSRNVRIKILKWGCYKRSKEILKGRTAYRHVRRMYNALKGKA